MGSQGCMEHLQPHTAGQARIRGMLSCIVWRNSHCLLTAAQTSGDTSLPASCAQAPSTLLVVSVVIMPLRICLLPLPHGLHLADAAERPLRGK